MIHRTPLTPTPSSSTRTSNGPVFAPTTNQEQKKGLVENNKDDVDYLLDLFDDVEAIVFGDNDSSGHFDERKR